MLWESSDNDWKWAMVNVWGVLHASAFVPEMLCGASQAGS
jgi:hypothetical protein